MTALVAVTARAALCGPRPDPISARLDELVRSNAALFRAWLAKHDAEGLRRALVEARTAMADIQAQAAELAREFSPATQDELEDQLARLLHAFPHGSPEDAAGYGAQLGDDVIALRPSWRGLRVGCERVRLRQKFTRLPAIATVWDAIGTADREVLAAARMIDDLPLHIARAETFLAPASARPTPRSSAESRPDAYFRKITDHEEALVRGGIAPSVGFRVRAAADVPDGVVP